MTKRERNKLIKQAFDLLEQAHDLLLEANDEEYAALENWAENLQGSDRYAKAEERSEILGSACEALEDLKGEVETILNDF